MNRKKWFAIGMLLLAFLLVSTEAFAQGVPSQEQQSKIERIVVKGKELPIAAGQGYAYIDENGRTMVPLRAIGEAMGLDVQWQSAQQRIVMNGGTEGPVVFHMGSSNYTMGGQQKTMDTVPVTIQGRVHVPVRFVVESAGGLVDTHWLRAMSGNYLEIIIYFNRDAVTPTPPDWATGPGDYTTFEYTNAYLPENWAIITDLRARAANGEDVSVELEEFVNSAIMPYDPPTPPFVIYPENKRYDTGIGFEALLIATEIADHGYNLEKYGKRTIDSFGIHNINYKSRATEGQDTINAKWKFRLAGLCGKTSIGVDTIADLGWTHRGAYYQALLPQFEGNENMNRIDYSNEHYFDKVRNNIAFADFCGDWIYYDYMNPFLHVAPYNDNGTMMFDLVNISDGLGWTNNTYDYFRTSKDRTHVTLTRLGSTMKLEAGSNQVIIDGKTYTMSKPMNLYWYTDSTTMVIDEEKGMPMVPQDFITEILGQEMTYNKEKHYWLVNKPENMGNSNLKEWNLGMSAVIAMVNEKNPYLLGMVPRCNIPTPGLITLDTEIEVVQDLLAESWDCYNGDDVKYQAQALLDMGHRSTFQMEAASANATPLVKQLDKKWGDKNILAWDMFRVAHLASWGYSAEYLTLSEAMELTEAAAQQVRQNFSSWDEAYANYLDGYLWWSGNDTEEYEHRKQLYQDLKEIEKKQGVLFNDALFRQDVIPYTEIICSIK